MTRSTRLALTLAFATLTVAPALAQQGSFPDVPANHWAYQALDQMKKDGLLVGYPDGLFRGGRPATRYEVAVAMHAAYTTLKNATDAMQAQLNSLQGGDGNPSGLQDQVGQLQQQVNALKGYRDDVANLQRAADTFEKELDQLGVDVEAMKRTLNDLGVRVGRLEARKLPVAVSGDLNVWLGAGNSADRRYGLNKDGRLLGIGTPDGTPTGDFPLLPSDTVAVGLTKDVHVLHEAAFAFTGTNEKGPRWHATAVATDMFGLFGATPNVAFGNQSDVFNPSYLGANTVAPGLLGYREGSGDVYLQDASIALDGRLGSVPVSFEVGRIGYKVSPYLLQRIDNTSYFDNSRWDDGRYYIDGATLGFGLGPVKLDVFGGKSSTVRSVNGVAINPIRSGAFLNATDPDIVSRLDVDRTAGIRLNVPFFQRASLDLAYLLFDSDTPIVTNLNGQTADRVAAFGGDVGYRVGGLQVGAGYHQTNLQSGGSNVSDDDNQALNLRVGYDWRNVGVYGEYRYVDANYLAPGDWGRLGVLRNPTNIDGFRVGGHVDVAGRLRLTASGEFLKGRDDAYAATTRLGEDSRVSRLDLRLDYALTAGLSAYAAYENTRFSDLVQPDVFLGGDPAYRWTTFGLGYGLGSGARLNLQYEFSHVGSDYQVSNGANFRGGFLTTQLSIKF